MRGADFSRRLRRCVGQHSEILSWKFTRHLREHAAHQVGDFVHLHTAIEDEAEFVLLVEQSAIDRALLRIGRADSIEEFRLPLPELSAAIGGDCVVLERWRWRDRGVGGRSNVARDQENARDEANPRRAQ